MRLITIFILALFITFPTGSNAKDKEAKKDPINTGLFSSLKPRMIGPALTSGRIIDFAVNPKNHAHYYVAVACGGVWETKNAGITYKPIFDKQDVYSVGCVEIDPTNVNVVWVGSGENNSQRSVAWGNGIYKSLDGGKSWKNMGLKTSAHIGKIVIDPNNSDVVYVAAFGPLWAAGGERGLYKTTDGGETWNLSLEISEDTGVSDIVMDPRDPKVLYAASYQRRRHTWTLINGGPEAALYKTVDAGKTWNKLANGFPEGELGRIGIAISPVNPDYIYALVEAIDKKGGMFRSTDRGESWEKQNDHASTSAQYYQELVCDPNVLDRVYTLETYLQRTDDGGKTWKKVGNKFRHVDDHALWIDPNNSDHLLVGGDGGVYESYDFGVNWRHFENLPVTQFYRIAVDNDYPFYNVYGGTQDNNTWGGPSATTNNGGITNEDWFKVVGGDGYEPQIDPKNPNIVYAQAQYGWMVRFDKKTGESTFIQPQPELGEEHRWNWDTPLMISPWSNKRLYTANNRVYRSDDQGSSWKAVSPDLTAKIDRNNLEIMGKVWSPETVAKNASTSLYGNIVSLTESPIKEDMLYVGTDDGLVQFTNDGGKTWVKLDNPSGVPENSYVSDVLASGHEENTVYALFNNHKRNDFKPYIRKSTNNGTSWTKLEADIPEHEPVWTIVEDHINPKLLFVGTEYNVYFTIDGGKKWVKLGGMPPVAMRDLDIQKRENDLAIGTFGRGIYILDDYTPIREMTESILEKDAHIFPIKAAKMFFENDAFNKSGQGAEFFRAKNPKFGAVFTYYLKDGFKSLKSIRKKKDKDLKEDDKYEYPTFAELTTEDEEEKGYLVLVISDATGKVIRRLTAPSAKGMHRINWDLSYSGIEPISQKTKAEKHSGFFVIPGSYKVHLAKYENNEFTDLTDPVDFNVESVMDPTFKTDDMLALNNFRNKLNYLYKAVRGTQRVCSETMTRIKDIENAMLLTPNVPTSKIISLKKLKKELREIIKTMNGNSSISKRAANQTPSINGRVTHILYSTAWSNADATGTAKEQYAIISVQLPILLSKLQKIIKIDLVEIERDLDNYKAPWTSGRIPEWKPE